MIQTVINRFKCLFDLSKVDQPAGMRIHLTTQLQTDKKGMSVQTPAFMAFRYVRQVVGGFKLELFKNHGAHNSLRIMTVWHNKSVILRNIQ